MIAKYSACLRRQRNRRLQRVAQLRDLARNTAKGGGVEWKMTWRPRGLVDVTCVVVGEAVVGG